MREREKLERDRKSGALVIGNGFLSFFLLLTQGKCFYCCIDWNGLVFGLRLLPVANVPERTCSKLPPFINTIGTVVFYSFVVIINVTLDTICCKYLKKKINC